MTDLLAGDARRLDALLARAQRDGRLPSMTAGLLRDGRLVWTGSAGEWTGDAAGDPLDTQYRIGSITKTFTAVLLLQARDEGLVDLDQPLARYVPEAPFAERTLRALLSHTSGIPGEPTGLWWERSEGADFAALVAGNDATAPARGSGEAFGYSNLAFGLLGEVLGRVRADPWWSQVQKRILGPLGMGRTTYHPTAPHAQGWSVSHLLGTLTPEPHTDTGAMAPAGQLWSTVTDLASYARFVLAGHPDVLPAATLEEAAVEVLPGGGYGLGFGVPLGAGRLVGHSGTMPGFMASFYCDRVRGTAFIGLSNGTHGQQSVPLATAMLAELARCEPEVVAPWLPASGVPAEVRELVGGWFWGERAFEIRWETGELRMVEVRPGEAYEEYHREDRGWVGTDGTLLEVVRRPDGSVSHLLSETYLFTRAPYDPAAPIPGGPPQL